MLKKVFQTILVIIFTDFFMFQQFFLSPQAKRMVIISTKQVIYELPHKFLDDLKLRIFGNKKTLKISQISTQLEPSAQSSSKREILSILAGNCSKIQIELFPHVLYQGNSTLYLI